MKEEYRNGRAQEERRWEGGTSFFLTFAFPAQKKAEDEKRKGQRKRDQNSVIGKKALHH